MDAMRATEAMIMVLVVIVDVRRRTTHKSLNDIFRGDN